MGFCVKKTFFRFSPFPPSLFFYVDKVWPTLYPLTTTATSHPLCINLKNVIKKNYAHCTYLRRCSNDNISPVEKTFTLAQKDFQSRKCKDSEWIYHSIYNQKTCGLICFRTIDFGESAFLSTFDQTKANEWTINWLYLEGPTALLFCFTTLRVV